MRRHVYVLLLLVPLLAGSVASAALPGDNSTSVGNIVGAAASNPRMAATILIEFLLGVALGYIGVKAIKYILAFIGILLLGSALSAWSLGSNPEELAKTLGMELKDLLPVLKQFVLAVGVTIVGPSALGVLVGVILAMIRQ
ncbi:MAG: hypothetical protein F7C38_06905 [Desulfurococcales archaeon]|nr:hypothetical protein [Desulfurococcales archaeon]